MRVFQGLPSLIKVMSQRKKKIRTPICLKYSKKNFLLDRLHRFQVKGETLISFAKNLILEKKSK